MRKSLIQPKAPKCQCSSKYLKDLDAKVKDFMKEFVLNDVQLKQLSDVFQYELDKGLGKDSHAKADMRCYPTYVHHLPTGGEEGNFIILTLAKDLFRFDIVTLKADCDPTSEGEEFPLPLEMITSTGELLFDYIAECLCMFLKKREMSEVVEGPIGFNFFFPHEQLGLESGVLRRWLGKFEVADVVGQDVVPPLKDAFARAGGQMDVVAVTNYTTDILLACSLRNEECRIGCYIGNDACNASYHERSENIETLDSTVAQANPYTIVNCEWGELGDSGTIEFIRTYYDRLVDRESVKPNIGLFEKLIASNYMCEIFRHILIDTIKEDLLFANCPNNMGFVSILETKVGCIEPYHISQIEEDSYPDFLHTKELLLNLLGLEKPALTDIQIIKYLVHVLSKRSASIAAVGLSNLINRVAEPVVNVALDGGLYKYHPKYATYMREVMQKLVDPNIEYDLEIKEKCSGEGAALVAALSSVPPATEEE